MDLNPALVLLWSTRLQLALLVEEPLFFAHIYFKLVRSFMLRHNAKSRSAFGGPNATLKDRVKYQTIVII